MIDRLPRAQWSGPAWRHIRLGRDPSSGAGARIQGGRWNPPNSFSTIYLGTERATAIAEFERLVARQSLAVGDFLPRALYCYDTNLDGLLDLRQPETRAELEITLDVLALTISLSAKPSEKRPSWQGAAEFSLPAPPSSDPCSQRFPNASMATAT